MSRKQDIEQLLLRDGVAVRNSKELGEIVALTRSNMGMRQEDLADWVRVSRTYVGDLERGTESKRLARLFYIMEILGLEIVIRRRGLR